MRICLYCNQEKNESEFSEEHVLPQAVGGNLSPTNPFKTPDVCKRCNNVAGLFIDTGFIKSWFTHAARSEEARRHIRLDQNTIFPLSFMGPIPELAHEDKICDFWLGPTGDSIYHFHSPYEEVQNMPVLVGPAPNLRQSVDPGFVFVFLVPSNSVWWIPILRSIILQFKNSALFLANGNAPAGGAFSPIPENLAELLKTLESMRGESHHMQLQISIDGETRFLAKLALGMGHLFLAPSFSSSPDAKILRDMMWARTREERANIPMRGSGFLGQGDFTGKEFLSWREGHVLTLLPVGGTIALHASFYGKQCATIQISENPEHWAGRGLENGVVYVVSPGLRRCVGPISLSDFLAHHLDQAKCEALIQLEREIESVPPLPPAHIQAESASETTAQQDSAGG